MTLPTKLKSDGIREALFEIRFGATPSPELTVANLLSVAAKLGKGARTESLPQADIPAPIRRHDPNLMFQPTVQVQFDSGRLIRVGEQVVSYHAVQPYPGWKTFAPELQQIVSLVFQKSKDVPIIALGFRYLNMLGELQGISSIADLNLGVSIASQSLNLPFHLSYRVPSKSSATVIRVASAEFVQGVEHDFGALVDIDVRTLDADCPQTETDITCWIEDAHTALKTHFFSILKPETVKKLT